jgi:hypothetical protein
MKTNNNKAADLRASITAHIERLAKLTDEALISKEMQAYLESMSRFHNYSPHNQLLILMQNPDASRVAGYKKWIELNRYVKKGEKGIPILAPCFRKTDPDDEDSHKVLSGFRVVYVFDVSQTDGEPLPEPPDWKSPARQQELEDALIAFAESKGIMVESTSLQGNTQGMSKGGEILLAEEAGTKTFIHEIAHELLHQNGYSEFFLDNETKELEAEATAFVVASHFGLPDLASPNYLALWEADSEKIMARLERIRNTSAEIIQAVGEDSVPEIS